MMKWKTQYTLYLIGAIAAVVLLSTRYRAEKTQCAYSELCAKLFLVGFYEIDAFVGCFHWRLYEL